MILLSIDVGICNLAYCLYLVENDNIKILLWDIIDLNENNNSVDSSFVDINGDEEFQWDLDLAIVNTNDSSYVIGDNVYNIVKVREFAIKNGFESIFRIATEISRLYNENIQENIALNFKQKSFFADFLRSERTINACHSVGRRLFYADLSKRLITGKDRVAPCSFQSTGLFGKY